ncbi:hypothetical protein MKZ38_000187 [Zalerion maritima]|uniref:PD-(D/E)XK nuclease-like domain-containing protein n=1 Tax=Zalerion maritima TaxID=339359 RepID=A0AAD5RFN3_9PEZI|nr:hypothetical protein MKZ38_000187 [Zalerion maritima]
MLSSIEQWLNAIISDDKIDACHHPSVYPFAAMPSPPSSNPSSTSGRLRDISPPKRRKVTDDGVFEKIDDVEDVNRTPRNYLSSSLSYRLSNPPRLRAPSLSSTTSSPSRVSASSSKQRRSVSPAKRTQSLQALDKPVHYVALEDNATQQLPVDAQSLYNRIYDITVEHDSFLPCKARTQICSAIGRQLRDSWFRDKEGDQARAQADLHSLREIETAARECLRLGRSEAAWNLEVHGPLLKLALAQHRRACRELVTTARIAVPCVPSTSGRGGGGYVESKMVDFALVLALENDLGLDEDDERLASLIQNAVWSQPADMQFINQTQYPPLQFRPVAISIETKAAGLAEDGRVQLGVWTAAWHRRISSWSLSDKATIITLPLLLVVEHEWKIFFACDRGDRLEIIGDMSIGDTKTLLGLYTIISVLRELADWVEGPFRTWFAGVLISASGGREHAVAF